jgi:HEAT repeat protein
MIKPNLTRTIVFLTGFLFLMAGCASLDKARTLHSQGKNSDALKMAAKYLEDGDPEVRLEAVELVGQIGGDEAGRVLMPLLDEDDEEYVESKNAAIRTIGKLKYAKASKKLVAMSITTKGDTFEEIAKAIDRIGPPAIDLLVKRYNKAGSASEKQAYKKAMKEVGPQVATAIAASMKGKSFFENRDNYDLLIELQNPKVAQWLLEKIEDEEVADLVVEALIRLRNKAVLPIMEHLESFAGREGFVNLKERLIYALGKLKAKKAEPLLKEMLKDSNERVVQAAEKALTAIFGI